MKKDELMLWDWVMYNGNIFIDDEYEPSVPLEPIQINCGEDIDLAIEGCYTPIPLTVEILEKNGFTEIGEGFELPSKYLAKSRFFIFKNKNKKTLYILVGGDWASLNYVHELQHALRMCGLSELADNFKV